VSTHTQRLLQRKDKYRLKVCFVCIVRQVYDFNLFLKPIFMPLGSVELLWRRFTKYGNG